MSITRDQARQLAQALTLPPGAVQQDEHRRVIMVRTCLKWITADGDAGTHLAALAAELERWEDSPAAHEGAVYAEANALAGGAEPDLTAEQLAAEAEIDDAVIGADHGFEDEPDVPKFCPGCPGRGTGSVCCMCGGLIPPSRRRKPGDPSEIAGGAL